MNFNQYLHIPERMLIGKKLPKAFFLKNFELSSTEKKVLSDAVGSMELLANIKPSNSNVPPYADDFVIYEEIQVIVCQVQGSTLEKVAGKIANLVQKYIPYPILMVIEDDTSFIINTCEKRINQNDKNKRTIEEDFTTPLISKLYTTELSTAFLNHLIYNTLDITNLETLYSSYSNAILKFKTAHLTGTFNSKRGPRTAHELQILQEIERLNSEIQKLTNRLKKETQMNQRVALNMEIQKLRTQIETTTNLLATI
jgi:hypothetical protein